MNNPLKRIDPSIIETIVKSIRESGSIRKTPLMEKTNMNYVRLNAYLQWLEMIDFVKIDNRNVMLTENGLKFSFKCSK